MMDEQSLLALGYTTYLASLFFSFFDMPLYAVERADGVDDEL